MSTFVDRIRNLFTDHQAQQAAERAAEQFRDSLLSQSIAIEQEWRAEAVGPADREFVDAVYQSRLAQINHALAAAREIAPGITAHIDVDEFAQAVNEWAERMGPMNETEPQDVAAFDRQQDLNFIEQQLGSRPFDLEQQYEREARKYDLHTLPEIHNEVVDDVVAHYQTKVIAEEFNRQLTEHYGYIPTDHIDRQREPGYEYGTGPVVAQSGDWTAVEVRTATETVPAAIFIQKNSPSLDLPAFRLGDEATVINGPFGAAEVVPKIEHIPVSPEAHRLADQIDERIASLDQRYKEIDEDSYTTRGANRDERGYLQTIKEHLLTGHKNIDLTTAVDYMQDESGIALDKDVYERVISFVEPELTAAKALGHTVDTTEFSDGESRWDFAYREEQEYYDSQPFADPYFTGFSPAADRSREDFMGALTNGLREQAPEAIMVSPSSSLAIDAADGPDEERAYGMGYHGA